MNAVTQTRPGAPTPAPAQAPKSPLDLFMGTVLPKARQDVLSKILPAHVKPERFLRNFSIAVNQHPKLLNCEPGQVFNEVSKAAALGLYMDPQLGEAYLITGGGYGNVPLQPQLRVGYRGLIKLARQSGEIKTIYAHEVHQFDYLDISLGDEKRIIHKPMLTGDRGPIVLYYAVVKYVNGETDFEPMTIDQIHRIRDKSDGWKAFKNGKIKSTPWSTDEEEMAKKTVLRRLLKRIPQSPELADAVRHDDVADGYAPVTETNPAISHARPADALRIEAPAQTEEAAFQVEDQPVAEPQQKRQAEPEADDDDAPVEDAETEELFPGDAGYQRQA